MLKRNDLIEYLQPARKRIRLLWCPASGDAVAAIDAADAGAMPEVLSIDLLRADLEAGHARLLLEDPYLVLVADDERLPQRHRQMRDQAWSVIEGLVTSEPAIYFADRRGKLIEQCAGRHCVTRRSLYKYLRRYWQRGQTRNALLPDYGRCGGKGKERTAHGASKLGRPVKYSDKAGLNVTPDLRRVFQVGTQRFLLSGTKFTVADAYLEIKRTFLSSKTIDPENGRIRHRPIEAMENTGLPTIGQYRYWLQKDFKSLEIKRCRVGAKKYDKDLRGLLGTSTAEVLGPGDRYQIDATIADVYLVSRLDREKIIGRPVLYVVIDVFSRMIAGLYVGLEGPSWVGAMMALANTHADKAAYCRRFGINIDEEDWPCHYLPGTLLGDRGEIESAKINSLINNFHVTVENAASYRADWKGIVEQRFHLLPARFKPYVPGYVETDFRARGGKDYRLDAVLDLDEFTKIVIWCALYYNSHHELKKYDKDRDVLADGVPAVPIELWQWGAHNRSGRLRSFPEELVRFSLLPTDVASVTTFGIRWRGSHYTCPKAVEQRWFDLARQRGSWLVAISYDPRDLEAVYLHHESDPAEFEVCSLTERSRAHRGLSLWELEQQTQADRRAGGSQTLDRQMAECDVASNISEVVEQAKRKKARADPKSAARRTGEIRGNRGREKEARRRTETFRLAPPPTSKPPNVVPFPAASPGEPDYSEPDIDEILKPGGEDG